MLDTNQREIAESQFERNQRREAEVENALQQERARHEAAVNNMHRLRTLRLARDAKSIGGARLILRNCTTDNRLESRNCQIRALEVAMAKAAAHFDADTIALMKVALDEAWNRLPPKLRATMLKTSLAERILKSAAAGERNRERLREAALRDLAT